MILFVCLSAATLLLLDLLKCFMIAVQLSLAVVATGISINLICCTFRQCFCGLPDEFIFTVLSTSIAVLLWGNASCNCCVADLRCL